MIITVFYLRFWPPLWLSPLGCLIFNLCPCYVHGEWFRQDSGVVSSWLSPPPPPSILVLLLLLPTALSAQTDKYLFPRWRLLTASKPGKSLALPPSHWGKVTFTLSQSSVSTSRSSQGPSSIRGGAMTLLPCNQQRDSLIEPPLISRHNCFQSVRD